MVKVSTSELPPRQMAMDIEVEQGRLDRAIEEAFRRVAGRVNVPGFRKGKAPRHLVERMVGRESIVEDALEHLVPLVVNEAIEEEKVEAYGRPRVEKVDFDPLRVRAVVPLAPHVELGDYKSQLRIDAETVEIAQEEIENVLTRLRESHSQWVPVERAAKEGDRVGIDVKGEVVDGDRVLLDSRDAEYVVDPEGPQPAPGFAAELVGMTAGDEKTFTLALADDYREEGLANQPVRFSVKLAWVKERELPELNDDFAQQVGDFKDLAEVRSAIDEQLRGREEERARQNNESAALDKLIEISTVDVAPQVIEHQAQHMLETFAENLGRQGLKLEQYLKFANKPVEEFRDELRQDAEKRVKRSLALDAFAAAEQIGIDPTEVEAEVKKAAAGTENPEQTEIAALGDPATLERVESALREQKALARLVELASSTNGKASKSGKTPSKSKKMDVSGDETADTEPAPRKASRGGKKAQETA